MDFKKISINGITYGGNKSSKDSKIVNRNGISNVDFNDPLIYEHIETDSHRPHIESSLLFLSLCHTVLVGVGSE